MSIAEDKERSTLSESDRNVESLRISASNLLATFKAKLGRLQGNNDITRLYIRQGYDANRCFEEAIKFFGTNQAHYFAVDGTKFEEPRLDMLIFYAGAFAYRGTTKFLESGKTVSEPPSSAADYFSLSSAIPLSEEYSFDVFGEKGESGVEFDPTKVSSAIMRLSEYYMTFRALGSDPNLKIVLMDRTISGDIAHTSWKLRDYIREGSCVLTGFETSFGRISLTDLELGRMLIENEQLHIPSPRSQFLGVGGVALLLKEKNGPFTAEQIARKLGAKRERGSKIQKELSSKIFAKAFTETDNKVGIKGGERLFQLDENMIHYWNRLVEGTLSLANHIFSPPTDGHPLKIRNGYSGDERWMTCEDIDYLTLILITAILKECWERNILLLGIVKDSAANEMVRTVIPVLQNARLVEETKDMEKFESDTMLLQANSIVNSATLLCPWRTFEYDVCFRTVSPHKGREELVRGECRVEGAYKNVISPERTFVKAYFQLWESGNNPTLRSHVFLYDRPCYPQYDTTQELKMINRDAEIDEDILPAIHFLSDAPLSDLVMSILDSMGKEAIPEALGHNYPLFLADKRAKVAEEEASRSCVASVDLEITKSRLDQQVLFQGKFREFRSGTESFRKKHKKTSPQ